MEARLVPVVYRLLALFGLAIAAILLASCGSEEDPPSQRPAPLPVGVWTWIDVPGSVCSDGSPTGIAVNPAPGAEPTATGSGSSPRPPPLLVFLDGGGACWEALTCFGGLGLPPAAKPGPFGRAEFEARQTDIPGSVLDRDLPGNPFAGHTLVFVPYCTGDVHAGDASQDYPGAPRRYQHRGRRNVALAADLLQARLRAPSEVVVSGASAGGFGALLAHDALRRRWPEARGALVDDSGPPLVGGDFSPAIRAAWAVAWRLDEAVLPVCGEACLADLSEIVPALAARWPDDRLALLSSTQDEVIRSFVGLGPAGFEQAILRLRARRFDPLPNAATFLVPGSGHTMLGNPAAFRAGDVPLLGWLAQQVSGAPGWSSVGP
jgi:hypothetical protein